MFELWRFACATISLVVLCGACAGDPAAPQSSTTAASARTPSLAPEAVAPSPPPPTILEPGDQPAAALFAFDQLDRAAARAAAARPEDAELGYLLVDLESGRTLAEFAPDRPLIPASTTKLATAIVALDVLGPEHRFRTALLTRGEVRGGVLEGDLILEGGGDPALDVADLLDLAVRLKARGIRRVEGRLVIDDSALPRLSEIEPTQPPEAAYNPGIGALSLAFNRVRAAWRGGETVDVTTLPPLDEARFEAAPPARLPPGGVELARQGDEAVVWRLAARGRLPREAALPVKDPGLHAGHVFAWLARAQGIELRAPERGTAPPHARPLAVHESAPLRQLVRDMLVHSNNVMAEIIGLSAAQRLGDASAGLEVASALLLRHLGRLMPEVDWRAASLGNHSGLDGMARMTPRQVAALMRYGWRRAALPALLAGSGWSGTLADRFDDPEAALRVWAKTGTMNYGIALAGYLFPESGRPAAFVIMVSDIGARAAYDALARPGPAAEAAARAWNARARALQDGLIATWLEPLASS